MKLQKEIHQKRFKNEWQKVIVNLIFTHGWLKGKLKQKLKPYGVTMQQFNVLRILNGQYPNPISTSIIRERMLDKMSDASRIVDRLYQKDLIERKTCASDRRLVDVVITEKGRALLQKISLEEEALEGIASKNITKEEADLLSGLLDKIRG